MRAVLPAGAPLALALAGLLLPCPALALERQLQLAGSLGFATSSGPLGGPGPALHLAAGYGLNDAFTWYSTASYSLGFPGSPHEPRHGASLSSGVFYSFDYLQVVPYAGLGARFDLVATPGNTLAIPSAEVRGGVAWLLSRTVALDLQASYAFPFLERDLTSDFVSVSLGLRYTRDL